MRWLSLLSCASDALSVPCLPAHAQAQTQAQHDRIDELAQFAVATGMCIRLGFSVASDTERRLDPAVQAEIQTWPGDKAQLKTALGDAVQRQSEIFSTDLQFFSDHAKTNHELRNVKSVLLRYGDTCMKAAKDALFKAFISVPLGYDLNKAATATSDAMLEDGGLASWQTPVIAARGDMMMIAGACRHVIGPVRSDALRQSFGQSDDPRERAYYDRSFDSGLSDTELNMDLTRCERVTTRYRHKIAAIR